MKAKLKQKLFAEQKCFIIIIIIKPLEVVIYFTADLFCLFFFLPRSAPPSIAFDPSFAQ